MHSPFKSRSRKIVYSLGSIGLTGFLQLMSTFLLFFLIERVHLDPRLASLIFLISYGIWNGINDPIVGNLSDRTRSRWGRRTPYIILGIPIMLVFSCFIWAPPIGGKPLPEPNSFSIFLYMTVVVALFEFGFTMVTIPYAALFPEMWSSIHDRSEVVIYRESLSILGGVLAMVIFPKIVDILVEDKGMFTGWAWASGFMSMIFSVSFLAALLGINERKDYDNKMQPPFLDSIKTALKNRSWITAKVIGLMTTCTIDWVSAIVPFFATHSLGMDVGVISIMMGFQMIGTFSFFPLWRKLCISHGTKITIGISMVAFNLGLLLSLTIKNVFGVALMGLIGGISIGGLLLARKLMIADVIDEDELNMGVRREGVYMGIGASISKISSITVGASMSLLLSSIIGYIPGESKPPFMDMGIRIGMVGFPTIFTLILLIFLYFYPLGKDRILEIREKIVEVDKRKQWSNSEYEMMC